MVHNVEIVANTAVKTDAAKLLWLITVALWIRTGYSWNVLGVLSTIVVSEAHFVVSFALVVIKVITLLQRPTMDVQTREACRREKETKDLIHHHRE